jgi:predicted TIM-barrel fold metal-dependent hydrolase
MGINRVMWGTDYPHPEGTWPDTERQMVGSLQGLSDSDRAAVLGLNAVQAFDLDLPALNAIAAKIGPKKSLFLQQAA